MSDESERARGAAVVKRVVALTRGDAPDLAALDAELAAAQARLPDLCAHEVVAWTRAPYGYRRSLPAYWPLVRAAFAHVVAHAGEERARALFVGFPQDKEFHDR